MSKTSIISKLDAARRQLETAVNLYFHEGDPVSIHTLACAGHEIVENLNKGAGGKPTLMQTLMGHIKPDAQKDFHDILHEAQNFFKHSSPKGANQTVKLHSFYTDVILLDACQTYRRVMGERLPTLASFEMWAAITWAKGFMTFPGLNLDDPQIVTWAAMTRQEFFGMILPVAYLALITSPPTK